MQPFPKANLVQVAHNVQRGSSVIVPLWKLSPQEVGVLISAGFFGQLFGALFFGWIAERYGRMPALIASIATFGMIFHSPLARAVETAKFVARGMPCRLIVEFLNQVSHSRTRRH